MKIELFEKVLNIMIPGSKILTYEVLPRNQLNENNEWVPDTPAIFLSISYLENINSVEFARLSQMMTDMTGHEVNIDGGLSIRRYRNEEDYWQSLQKRLG